MTLNEEMELYDSICSPCRHYDDEDDSYCMKCRKVEKAIQKKNQPTHRELCELGGKVHPHAEALSGVSLADSD